MQKLIIIPINSLRVFDISMIPNLVRGNTNVPAMAITDRATDMMLNL